MTDPTVREATPADVDAIRRIAERDGRVLGYASDGSSDEENVAVLGAIYVDPDLWGEGLGTALLEAFETFVRERGDECVRVRVLSENVVGTSFYERHSYERVETELVELFGETVSEDVYRRRLDETA